jgi:hypothetical protein
MSFPMMRKCFLLMLPSISAFMLSPETTHAQGVPYPPSLVISDMTFEWSTHERHAPGSDNWPITWADDGHQYTSWGDGGGFGGTNDEGRVSLGVAVVKGGASSYTGYNHWGGEDATHPATFGGKSYGIISTDKVLYKWVSPGSGAKNYNEVRLYRSTNRGASWTAASWTFKKQDGFVLPTFLQFGRNYAGARDGWVYIYANKLQDSSSLTIQQPGEITLMRVPKADLMEREAYQFFAGMNEEDKLTWTSNLTKRRPVFTDRNGVGWNTSVSYNPGLRRYLLITEHHRSSEGSFGLFDAPEPWGPWTTVAYTHGFGEPHLEASTFFDQASSLTARRGLLTMGSFSKQRPVSDERRVDRRICAMGGVLVCGQRRSKWAASTRKSSSRTARS